MAFVDDPNKNTGDNQIAGGSPLSSGGATPAATQDTGAQTSGGSSQPSQIQAGSQTSTTNKKAPKASSGMFTNIQKYVEKNKPQAQNIATAVTGDVS